MKIKYIQTFFICIVIFLLGVCKYSIQAEIKFTDILELISKNFKGHKYSEAEIKFGVNSIEKCEEDKVELIKILSNQFKDLSDVECKKIEEDSYLIGKFQLPIIRLINGQYDIEEGLLNITVNSNKNIKIGLYIDKDEFAELNKSIEAKYSQALKIEDFSISFDFENDTDKEINLKLDSIYTNGKAYPKRSLLKLEAKQKMSFTLSNILKEYIYQNSFSDFLNIEIIDKPDK